MAMLANRPPLVSDIVPTPLLSEKFQFVPLPKVRASMLSPVPKPSIVAANVLALPSLSVSLPVKTTVWPLPTIEAKLSVEPESTETSPVPTTPQPMVSLSPWTLMKPLLVSATVAVSVLVAVPWQRDRPRRC